MKALNKRITVTTVIALLLSSILFACGGGGGGGGNPPNTKLLNIDTGQEAAHLVMSFKILLEGLGAVGSAFSDVYTEMGSLTSGTTFTFPCNIDAGSFTVIWSDNDGSTTKTSGDTFTVSFNDCEDPFYEWTLVSGEVVITLINETGLKFGHPTHMRAKLTLNNLQLQALTGATGTLNGSKTIEFAEDQILQTAYYKTDGDPITVKGTLASGVSFDATIKDYTYGYDIDFATDPIEFTWDYTGDIDVADITVDSTHYSGSMHIETTQTFAGSGDEVASSGSLKITGPGGSVIVTALSSTTVRIDIDVGDNGSIEATETVTWTAILF